MLHPSPGRGTFFPPGTRFSNTAKLCGRKTVGAGDIPHLRVRSVRDPGARITVTLNSEVGDAYAQIKGLTDVARSVKKISPS